MSPVRHTPPVGGNQPGGVDTYSRSGILLKSSWRHKGFGQGMSIQVWFFFVACCSAAWLALGAYALYLRQHHFVTRSVVWLAAANAIWTLSLVKPQTLDINVWLALSQSAEALRTLAWWTLVQSIAGFRLLNKDVGVRGLRAVRLVLFATLAVILYAGWSPWLDLPTPALTITSSALIVAALIPLVAMEQLYRNMDVEQRWAVKFILLAVVVSTGVDLVTHLHTLLYHRIDPELWLARGPVSFVTAALMLVGLRRVLKLPAVISLSHQLVFYTGTLLALGVALLLVAGGSWYIRQWGGEWSHVIQAVFLAAMLATLAVVLLSGRFRARLQVFLSRHFLPYRYDHRMEWLRLSESLTQAAGNNDLPNTVIRALARIVESPAGLLFMIRRDTLHCVASWNMTPPSEPPRLSGVDMTRLKGRHWILNCQADSPQTLPAWLTAMPRAWLAIPLFDSQGPMAMVVLGSPLAPRHLNWEDYDLLKVAAQHAGSVVALQRASEALGQAQQFAALHQSTAFLAHDIKTMVAQLSLLSRNAERHRDNPEFIDDMIATVRHSVEKMENILAQLRQPREQPDDNEGPVDVAPLAHQVVSRLSRFQPAPTLDVQGDTAHVQGYGEDLATVLNHLIRNAQQACDVDGRVHVCVHSLGDRLEIRVEDSGRGMSEDFIRDRLFTPFHSTKGLSGMGIGVFQSRSLVEAMGGSLQVSSREGQGSCFTISLPLDESRNREQA